MSRFTWKVLLVVVLVPPLDPSLAVGQEQASWSERVPRVQGARHFYVGTQGRPGNPGTREAPWDLSSALLGWQKVAPGDVIWIQGGRYRSSSVRLPLGLAGKEGAPIHVRAVPGERVTIYDGQLTSTETAAHVWLWDLEITSSVPPGQPTAPSETVGMFIRWGKGSKFINLVIHGIPGGGASWWTEAGEGEFHGCLIYDNGWQPDAPKHGHCLYTQNRDGIKTISNCIMSVPSGDPSSIYASGTVRAFVENYLIEDNIILDRGLFLVGGGRPSRGIRVLRNHLLGVDMRIGNGPENEDCEIRDNILTGGTLTIDKYKKVVDEGNLRSLPEQRAALIPNKYDPQRAHLVVYNGAKKAAVLVEVAGFLKPGEEYRLLDPKKPFDAPLHEGKCDGPTLSVPMKDTVAAFVVVKGKGK